MTRDELEHVIRAAADAIGQEEFVVVGSQAVLGQFPNAPGQLLRSMEADIYPAADPAKAEDIDGALGEGSAFHDAFGYYAHGVGPETAKAPAGWESRLVPVVVEHPTTGQRAIARCLEIHDLVLSKCVRGEDKDYEFTEAALREGLAERATLLSRIPDLPVGRRRRDHVEKTVRGIASKLEGD
ncbi:MAG: hypothetical protein M3433_03315 [Actinomycetota bacterium]|nr:hypothetical protein [Actinomycetota bacterium]